VPRIRNSLAIGVAIALFGCGNGGNADEVVETAANGKSSYTNAVTVSSDGNVEPITMEHESIADKAILALADHLDIPVTRISVDSVRSIDWPDSSIGCPQPDQAYMQVITPGHRIALRVEDKLYTVHEANGRAFVCETRKPAVSSVTTQLELEWAPQAAIARADLAEQLGVDPAQIIIASARGTTWTDSSLGCAEPGGEYEIGDADGYVLTLRHGSRNYTYHTDLVRIFACPPFSED
jgi:hypothetical protein